MSDYLTDEEQVARLKSWWDENGKSLAIGLVVVVAGFVGYRWFEAYRTEQALSASELYETFLASDGDARDAALEALAEQASGTSYEVLALLHVAKGLVRSNDYAAAEAPLRRAVAAAPEALLADVARLRLARVLQQLEQTEAALSVLGEIRSVGFRSSVAELRGDIHWLRGERELAHAAYAAALQDAGELVGRPVLEMKLADTAAVESAQNPDDPPDSAGPESSPAVPTPEEVDAAEQNDA